MEGFFEIFATTVIAFLFARLGLVSAGLAAQASLLAAALYLAGARPASRWSTSNVFRQSTTNPPRGADDHDAN